MMDKRILILRLMIILPLLSCMMAPFDLAGKEPNVDITQFKKKVTDLSYASQSERQILDIIFPEKGTGPYSIIMVIHGGGWKAGHKRMQSLVPFYQIPSQGYALVTLNYRYSTEALWPAQLYDAKAAIRFIRANAEKYNLKKDKILVWGASAGGHIAEMLAATNDRPEFEDLTMGFDKESSSVQGVISWYGVSDMSSLISVGKMVGDQLLGFDAYLYKDKAALASPITYVTKDYPPLLLIHGTNDELVPYQQSLDMYHKVNEKAGTGRALIKLISGATHANAPIKSEQTVIDNLYFADQILWDGFNPLRSDSLNKILMNVL